MDYRLTVCVKKLCKICSKWPIRELFISRLQHWCFIYNSINEIAIQECEGIVRQNKIMVSFSQSVYTCRFRLQETVQNMWMIGAYLREQIIVRLFTKGGECWVSLPSRNPNECFSLSLPRVDPGRRQSWSPTKQEMRTINNRGEDHWLEHVIEAGFVQPMCSKSSKGKQCTSTSGNCLLDMLRYRECAGYGDSQHLHRLWTYDSRDQGGWCDCTQARTQRGGTWVNVPPPSGFLTF